MEKEGNAYLSKLRNAVFLIAVYLYFAGFVYQYYLFGHFGISLGRLDVPFYHFFVYSYAVITDNWGYLALVGLIWIPLIVLGHKMPTQTGRPPASGPKGFATSALRGFLRHSLTILLALMLPTVFVMAKSTGDSLAVQMRMGRYVKSIKFFLKAGACSRYPEEFVFANDKEGLKLLTETTSSFYVLDQSIGNEKELPGGFTYVVSKDDICAARIWLTNVPKLGGGK